MPFGMQKCAAVLVVVAATAVNSYALDAKALKKPCDKAANYIVEQFDIATSLYKGVKADDVVTQALIVAALGDHPRKYREGHGPWMSIPAATIAKTADASMGPARDFTLVALQATQNEKYKAQIDTLKAKGPLPTGTISKTDELAPNFAVKEALIDTFWKTRSLLESKTKEVEINGAKVKWAEVLGDNLLKLQKPDGSFSDDMQANALGTLLLAHCYLALK